MFRLWRTKYGTKATYLCLAEAFEALKLRDIIVLLLDFYSTRDHEIKQALRVEPKVPKLGQYNIYIRGRGFP